MTKEEILAELNQIEEERNEYTTNEYVLVQLLRLLIEIEADKL